MRNADGTSKGFGFVEFHSEADADYAMRVMSLLKLYGTPIRLNKVCVLILCFFNMAVFVFSLILQAYLITIIVGNH